MQCITKIYMVQIQRLVSLVVVISCVLSILFGSRGRQFGVLSTWIFLGLVFPDHPPLVAHMAVLHCTRRGPYMGGIKTNQ